MLKKEYYAYSYNCIFADVILFIGSINVAVKKNQMIFSKNLFVFKITDNFFHRSENYKYLLEYYINTIPELQY